jgi:hypothetical protein
LFIKTLLENLKEPFDREDSLLATSLNNQDICFFPYINGKKADHMLSVKIKDAVNSDFSYVRKELIKGTGETRDNVTKGKKLNTGSGLLQAEWDKLINFCKEGGTAAAPPPPVATTTEAKVAAAIAEAEAAKVWKERLK